MEGEIGYILGKVVRKDTKRGVTSHLRSAMQMCQETLPNKGNKSQEVGLSFLSRSGNSKASVAEPMNMSGLGEITVRESGKGQIAQGFGTVF